MGAYSWTRRVQYDLLSRLILGNIKIIKIKRKYFYIYYLRYLIWVGDKDDVDRACAEPLLVISLARRHSVLDEGILWGQYPALGRGMWPRHIGRDSAGYQLVIKRGFRLAQTLVYH